MGFFRRLSDKILSEVFWLDSFGGFLVGFFWKPSGWVLLAAFGLNPFGGFLFDSFEGFLVGFFLAEFLRRFFGWIL